MTRDPSDSALLNVGQIARALIHHSAKVERRYGQTCPHARAAIRELTYRLASDFGRYGEQARHVSRS